MQRYVVDTSIVIQHFVQDTDTVHVDKLFERLDTEVELYLPEICLTECANVLWKRIRFHGLPSEQAESLLADLLALPLSITPTSAALPRALQIGLAHSLAIYDSVYIALAESLDCPLITVDVRQATAANNTDVTVKSVRDFA